MTTETETECPPRTSAHFSAIAGRSCCSVANIPTLARRMAVQCWTELPAHQASRLCHLQFGAIPRDNRARATRHELWAASLCVSVGHRVMARRHWRGSAAVAIVSRTGCSCARTARLPHGNRRDRRIVTTARSSSLLLIVNSSSNAASRSSRNRHSTLEKLDISK
jgi:hypothetical protein